MLNDHVEAIAVDDQEAFAVGCCVEKPVHDVNATEVFAIMVARQLVVIARNVNNSLARFHIGYKVLDNSVVVR